MGSTTSRPSRAAGRRSPAGLEYGPVPEPVEVEIAERSGLRIGGRSTPARGRRALRSVDPATGRALTRLAAAGAADVDDAVAAARAAQGGWARLRPVRRGRWLMEAGRLVDRHAAELATLVALETGLPVRVARERTVAAAGRALFHVGGWADKLATAQPGRPARPLGVWAVIVSRHGGLLAALRRLAPALATGGTCVLKPAPGAALATLRLVERLEEAGLPPGVLNVVTGAADTGAALAGHADVRGVALSGSRRVGRLVTRAVAGTGAALSLEHPGTPCHAVFEDASIDQAVAGILAALVTGPGLGATGGVGVLVQEPVLEEVLDKLAGLAERLRVGDPLDRNTDLGPLASRRRLDGLRRRLRDDRAGGASVVEVAVRTPRRGPYAGPVIVEEAGELDAEPIDGPMIRVASFRTSAEAVDRLGRRPGGGPGTTLWSDKAARAWSVAAALATTGPLWTNTAARFDPAAPLGGRGGPAGLGAFMRP